MRLYNTLTRTVEELVPREPGRVGMYVCGPTVQAGPHIGHGRSALYPDVLRRYLTWTGLDVFFVRNVTDVEDKIIAKSHDEGRPAAAVAEHYTRVYEDAMTRLGVLPPDVVPRATGHIIEMIELIAELVDGGHAYPTDGGDVWFAVRSFDGYGKLSRRDVDELRAGARVEVEEGKRDPLDFALWKGAKPGEPSWPSPWGPGRPGWHIECSAMAAKHLGLGFDVHGGGIDLQFPHHENEIAQSEAASGQQFARHWFHVGMLNLDDVKMSKSVGNVIGLAEALDEYAPDVLRMFYLSAHYRSPASFSAAALTDAAGKLERWRGLLRVVGDTARAPSSPEADAVREAFRDAMDDDLATPRALAAVFDAVTAGHAHAEAGRADDARALGAVVRELAGVLGLQLDAGGGGSDLVGPLVEELLAQRAAARVRRDFAAADAIRDRLAALGVVVEDTADGSRWHVTGGGSGGSGGGPGRSGGGSGAMAEPAAGRA